jgi:anti-sigma regulatory factor (Ser/Thr protein kinase)
MNKNSTFDGLPSEIRYTYMYPNGQSSLVMASAHQSMLRLDHFVTALKELWQIDETPFIKINAALSEMVTNAIVHGNHSSPDKNVYLQAVRSGNQYAFMIRDQGSGFDHKHLPDLLDPTDIDGGNGRGIFIARNLADEMYYAPKGNCVWLLFRQGT